MDAGTNYISRPCNISCCGNFGVAEQLANSAGCRDSDAWDSCTDTGNRCANARYCSSDTRNCGAHNSRNNAGDDSNRPYAGNNSYSAEHTRWNDAYNAGYNHTWDNDPGDNYAGYYAACIESNFTNPRNDEP